MNPTMTAEQESAGDRAGSIRWTEVVDRIRSGDGAAESELVRHFWRGVETIVRRASGDQSNTEDLCQDTFRVALEKIRRGDIREPQKLPGFIASLARNLVTEHFRRHPSDRAAADGGREPVDSNPSPLDSLLQREQAAIVRKVLEEMDTERDRQILFRYYVAEEEKERICAELGLTAVHFNRVLFRARERYRALYTRSSNQ